MLGANLDPNDPINVRLLRLLKPLGGGGAGGSGGGQVHAPEYFRLNHHQEEFSLCEEEDLQKNNR